MLTLPLKTKQKTVQAQRVPMFFLRGQTSARLIYDNCARAAGDSLIAAGASRTGASQVGRAAAEKKFAGAPSQRGSIL